MEDPRALLKSRQKKASKGKKKKGTTFFGITARTLMMAAAGLLVLTYLSVFFNPAKAWVMTIIGLAFAPAAALNLFLLLWSIARRSKAVLIPLIALLPSLIVIGRYFQFKDGGAEDNGNAVTVVSYNVGRFASSAKRLGVKSQQECADSVVKYLKSLDADIICLQEFYMKDVNKVKSYMKENFKGYEAEYYVYPDAKGCYGNVTLSKYHLQDKGTLDFDESANLAISCDCTINGTKMRIYNCHFQSYSISLSHIVKNIRGNYKETMKYAEDKLRYSIALRPKQVDLVMDNIEECPVESIVVGDFNDNPTSYTYHRLCRGRKDTFVEAGKGPGATYAYLFPFLRLDYILYPKDCSAVSHRVDKVRWSDHYPIISKINI